MGYQEAMEAAGATILAYKSFGSYQGDWWAKVIYNGKTGWVHGSYGSCSGCDAFQAEFYSWTWRDGHNHDGYWFPIEDTVPGCPRCDEYKAALVDFGRGYLSDLYSQEEAEREASRHLEWDHEATKMLEWIKKNAI